MSEPGDVSPPDDGSESALPGTLTLIVLVTIVLAAVGWSDDVFEWIAGVLAQAGTSDVGRPKDPGWIDRIFAADAVIGGVRLLGAVLAVYLVVGVVHNARRKLYPRVLGPLSVGNDAPGGPVQTMGEGRDRIEELEADNDALEQQVQHLQELNDGLLSLIEDSDEALLEEGDDPGAPTDAA